MTTASAHFPEGPVVLFTVADHRWAIPVRAVERVVHAVEISPCPKAPPIVLGIINVSGETVPVYNLSRRTGAADPPEISLEDKILLVRTSHRLAGLWANDVAGVVDPALENVARQPAPDSFPVSSALKLADGIALFQEPDQILSAPEEEQLTASLRAP